MSCERRQLATITVSEAIFLLKSLLPRHNFTSLRISPHYASTPWGLQTVAPFDAMQEPRFCLLNPLEPAMCEVKFFGM